MIEQFKDKQEEAKPITIKKDEAKPAGNSKKNCKDMLIISSDNRYKSFFDVWVLMLVGYSCFSSMYYVAFSKPTNAFHIIFDDIVEVHFWTDLVLSFLCEFKDPETNIPERRFKQIAIHYLTSWFPVDFVSVFPF